MHDWIHFIDSKEPYERIWEIIVIVRELYLGTMIIIGGFLTCKDGRIFGNKGELTAVIITSTFNKETMERLIELGNLNSSMIVLFEDLSPEEVDLNAEYTSGIKKEIKNFEGPKEFEDYLEKIHYKDFKEED
jgi:hypothetical protein